MNGKNKAIIFFDARNLLGGQKEHRNLGNKSDFGYKEIMDYFNKDFDVIRGYYYDGAPHKSQWSTEREALYHHLRKCGITLRLKEVDFTKSNPSQKGVDIFLTSDMISLAYENAYDIAIICSGDGDYVALIDLVKSKGKKVWILSFKVCTSKLLRECADKIMYIENIPDLHRKQVTIPKKTITPTIPTNRKI